jgi:hypothetical protein
MTAAATWNVYEDRLLLLRATFMNIGACDIFS